MFQALLFDFDGIVVDSEPLHYEAFARVLSQRCNILLTPEEYYRDYLAYTDAESFRVALTRHRGGCGPELLAELMAEKARVFRELFAHDVRAMPGAVELMRQARAAGAGVAICSGALREEIELGAAAVGALPLVQVIVSAEDVPAGKPDPAGYMLARQRLCAVLGCDLPAGQCLVIEDAPAGIAAGKSAGMRVLAVANSTSSAALVQADRVVPSLVGIKLEDVAGLAAR